MSLGSLKKGRWEWAGHAARITRNPFERTAEGYRPLWRPCNEYMRDITKGLIIQGLIGGYCENGKEPYSYTQKK